LRIGEILSLAWERVDLENNLLSVFAHKTNKIRAVPIKCRGAASFGILGFGKKN
jgi:site-specific recombinase XerD